VDGNSSIALLGCSTDIDSDRRAPLEDQDVQRSPGCMVRISVSDA
jgi:hypothetical protein